MPRKSRSLSQDPLASFPPWARTLAGRYYTKTISTFVLHGDVRDLQPADDGKGGRRFISLRSFLADELFGTRDLVVFYDRSGGIRLATPEMQKDFMAAVAGYDTRFGTEYAKAFPKDPARAFPLLESYARVRIADGKSVAFVIDFAETVAPSGDLSFMPGEDRYVLVTLVKWAQDPQFLAADFSVCLVAENLAELNPRIGRNPYASQIEIPLPTEKERLDYLEWKLSGRPIREVSEVNAQAMAQMTAGMSRVSLDRVLTEAMGGAKLTAERLKEKKKEIIQAEVHGLLEFIEPQHSIDMVAGHAQGDSGTSARVFSQIASFMGNTDYRGKIVWFLLTSRPDLLPVDLKRQGRAEEHLALFYPESHEERLELVRTMAKKARVQFDGDLGEVLPTDLPKMSGAELEAALVAVAECTSRELLPESYRQKPRDDVTRRIRELKLLLSEQ